MAWRAPQSLALVSSVTLFFYYLQLPLASLLFPEHAMCAPALEPSHLPFFLAWLLFPGYHRAPSLPSFKPLLECHLLIEACLDHQFELQSPPCFPKPLLCWNYLLPSPPVYIIVYISVSQSVVHKALKAHETHSHYFIIMLRCYLPFSLCWHWHWWPKGNGG